jgi:hypothetical protein
MSSMLIRSNHRRVINRNSDRNRAGMVIGFERNMQLFCASLAPSFSRFYSKPGAGVRLEDKPCTDVRDKMKQWSDALGRE